MAATGDEETASLLDPNPSLAPARASTPTKGPFRAWTRFILCGIVVLCFTPFMIMFMKARAPKFKIVSWNLACLDEGDKDEISAKLKSFDADIILAGRH
jgi:ABC-type glycerol-3-phosphate transport system permease component